MYFSLSSTQLFARRNQVQTQPWTLEGEMLPALCLAAHSTLSHTCTHQTTHTGKMLRKRLIPTWSYRGLMLIFFSFFDFHIKSPCFSTNKCDISKPLHTHTPDSHMFYLDFDSFMNMDIADVSLSVNSWLILCKVWKKISDPSLWLGLLMPCSCIWSLLPVILYI